MTKNNKGAMIARRRLFSSAQLLFAVALAALLPCALDGQPEATKSNDCQEYDAGKVSPPTPNWNFDKPDKPGTGMCDDAQPDKVLDCIKRYGKNAVVDTSGRITTPGSQPRGNWMRNKACDEPNEQKFAAKCRRTCATCCILREFDCPNADHPLYPCTRENKRLCSDVDVREMMEKMCPALCGTCHKFESGPDYCRDKALSSTCATNKRVGVCDDVRWRGLMLQQCAKTCDLCDLIPESMKVARGKMTSTTPMSLIGPMRQPPLPPPSPQLPGGELYPGSLTQQGIDQASNCYENRHLCDSNIYSEIMMRDCAQTCSDYLGGGGGYGTGSSYYDDERSEDSDCYDESPNCARWDRKHDFCDDEFYSDDSKEELCAYTCGFC